MAPRVVIVLVTMLLFVVSFAIAEGPPSPKTTRAPAPPAGSFVAPSHQTRLIVMTCGDIGYGDNPPINDTHSYAASAVPGVLSGQDKCPASGSAFSGELSPAIGGVYLFSRTGSDANGDGSGTTACYGSPADDHHGIDTTLAILDDNYGGSVGFTVTRDYNRSAGNTGFTGLASHGGPGNSGGARDCGDGIIEPCPPGVDDSNPAPSPGDPTGGCNHLDASIPVGSLPTACPTCIPAPANPAPNTWTTGATLRDYAGADGAIFVFVYSPATTGIAWTY